MRWPIAPLPYRVLSLPLLAALAACAAPVGEAAEVEGREDAIIYGDDDRVEVYATTDPLLQEIAQSAVGALVDERLVEVGAGGGLTIRALSLSEAVMSTFERPYCEDQPYATQPVGADCSGVLIDDDLFMTAAHCIPTQEYCDDFAVVFDFYYAADGELAEIGPDDVYECDSIQVISYLRDYAILRLDREVVGRRPAPVREGSDEIRGGQRISVIGHPMGLPMKIDDAGVAGTPYNDGVESFLFAADVQGGSSGSPIFTREGEVVGLVSRSQRTDGGFVNGRDCIALGVLEPDTPPLEIGGYVYRALHKLCNGGGGSSRLCRDPGVWCEDCGGGGCSAAGAGSGAGSVLWALAAVGWLARRRRRR
ncbi:MAG TPA: serine protease [Polyangiaceae bacterium LLY-WYZ-15_(1-7)]|nr:serine protease [Polyangiaceae bacterium LLY-WYZ-15_(1-7)]HJL07300.1 serine protease [Polyangiaceae bacterium LLY-WYZ-15_(1-7)]HJL23597.1 serine protease [Polyangiaceae bacterium LLY-WYZ-15_(1-7)]HJL27462.1 serine protease [Polyangiaceae bacterium LLY-WYZ-15_(1-7)]HJL47989.1 serine protease [Polyangiaceae bacterium LLY-WYZ-15_(1-7)]